MNNQDKMTFVFTNWKHYVDKNAFWNENDSALWWNDFISKVQNFSLLKQIIEELGDTATQYKKPVLGDLKRAYNHAVYGQFPMRGCNYCQGKNFIVIFRYRPGSHRKMIKREEYCNWTIPVPQPGDEFKIMHVSCVCKDENRLTWDVFKQFIFGSGSDESEAHDFIEKIKNAGKKDV